MERNKDLPEFSFFDGPPFATGLPHYGHHTAGTIKDVVTRYAHMTGHHVERRFGWDCHGVPVEMVVEKMLKISSRQEVLDMGIAAYNDSCRSVVMKYSSEWERLVTRVGRWIDFDNDYKTMDTPFMESVWWVFGEMFKKGLVYQGFKVMPYSMACATPLSNFEAGLNYQKVNDPAVTVSFPLLEEEGVSFLAWTTTPWTLPSNLALCVHPEMTYVRVHDNVRDEDFILLKDLLDSIYPKPKKKKNKKKGKKKDAADASEEQAAPPAPAYEVVAEFPGADLAGKRYQPLFDFFADDANAENYWQVLTDTYVTAESGTGIVHQAPAFGEDDYRVCMAAGLITKGGDIPCPINFNGVFTDKVGPFAGLNVKDADVPIQAALKEAGRLFKATSINHSYPFCYRTDTPLIYRAVPSWFVNVTALKDRIVANNKETHWVPGFVGAARFHDWLVNARDWAISRNRFWGTPLPIWMSEDGEEVRVISSVAELEEATGITGITDLHRDSVDDMTIPSSREGMPPLKRVSEVFDCWFESGSMPYAQKHYPFENQDAFDGSYFPADFIAEGLDQTRGWFYTLLVISTALFDTAPFKNVIVNGLVLAKDGKKMSKSKQNYPNPETEIIDVYGADALRLYLINSPVVRAEPLKFMTEGVFGVIRDVFNPWYNAQRFFTNYANEVCGKTGREVNMELAATTDNILDKWILSELETLIAFVRSEMEAYRLYTVVPKLVDFIELLTNWWLRLNRPRLKAVESDDDALVALSVLFRVLFKLSVSMAPFTPFLVEDMYKSLKPALPAELVLDSIHYLPFPEADESLRNASVEEAVASMRSVIVLARTLRDQIGQSVKYPLSKMVVIHTNPAVIESLAPVVDYIKQEANVDEFVVETAFVGYVSATLAPNNKRLGPRFGKAWGKMRKKIQNADTETAAAFLANGEVTIDGEVFTSEDAEVVFKKSEGGASADSQAMELAIDGSLLVLLDPTMNEDLLNRGRGRELLSTVQRLRKSAGLEIADVVDVWVSSDAEWMPEVLSVNTNVYLSALRYPIRPMDACPGVAVEVTTLETKIAGATTTIKFTRPVFVPVAQVADNVARMLASLDPSGFENGAVIGFNADGEDVSFVVGQDVVVSSDL